MAVQALVALLSPETFSNSDRQENQGVSPDLGTRVCIHIVVGPECGASFVAGGAALIEVPPWHTAGVKDVFSRRCAKARDIQQPET